MKTKVTYTIYGIAFIAGIFGLQAIAESNLSFTATIAGIAAIFALLGFGAKKVNKVEE